MSKVNAYSLAILDGKTPEEARVIAGYEGSVPSSAIDRAERVLRLREEVNAYGLGWNSVRSLKKKVEAARRRAQESALSASLKISQHDELLRAIELLETWHEDPS